MREFILHQAENRDQAFAFPLLHRWLVNWRARRQLKHLSELDDHVLSDIGFTRDELRQCLKLPRDLDPIAELINIRQNRAVRGRRGK